MEECRSWSPAQVAEYVAATGRGEKWGQYAALIRERKYNGASLASSGMRGLVEIGLSEIHANAVISDLRDGREPRRRTNTAPIDIGGSAQFRMSLFPKFCTQLRECELNAEAAIEKLRADEAASAAELKRAYDAAAARLLEERDRAQQELVRERKAIETKLRKVVRESQERACAVVRAEAELKRDISGASDSKSRDEVKQKIITVTQSLFEGPQELLISPPSLSVGTAGLAALTPAPAFRVVSRKGAFRLRCLLETEAKRLAREKKMISAARAELKRVPDADVVKGVDEAKSSPEEKTPVSEPRPHEFYVDKCMICKQCFQCTGYGIGCCQNESGSSGRPGKAGQECGCGSGRSGCRHCGRCRSCCDSSGSCRPVAGGNQAPAPEEKKDEGAVSSPSLAPVPEPEPEPRPHDFYEEQCMVCKQCFQCTGYGIGCCENKSGSSGRPEKAGQECGCGGGRSGCRHCGRCRSCCDSSGSCRPVAGANQAPAPEEKKDEKKDEGAAWFQASKKKDHNFVMSSCRVCTECFFCTGYGPRCVNDVAGTGRPGMAGVDCGCGSGKQGCSNCGKCKRCCDAGGECD